jgi:flagellar hook-associated protein 3 FlgL
MNAGNASYSAAERGLLAQQLRQLRSQLLSVANQSDGATGFVFGGQGATTQPFNDTADGVVAGTTGGVSNASPSENMPLSVDGAAVWLHARSGNGVFVTSAGDVDGDATRNLGSGWINAGQVNDPSRYTGQDYQLIVGETAGKPSYTITQLPGTVLAKDQPFQSGKAITEVPGISFTISGTPATGDSFMIKPSTPDLDVFGAIDRVLDTLGNANAGNSQVMQAVNSGLRDVDQVMSNFQSARAVAGEALNHLDGMESRNSAAILSAQTTRSNAEDLDMVKAVSEFTNKQTSYQAALQSYTMVQKLSLFNYINT